MLLVLGFKFRGLGSAFLGYWGLRLCVNVVGPK